MKYRICFSPEAEAQPVKLYVDISARASDEVAAKYTDDVVTYAKDLQPSLNEAPNEMTFVPVCELSGSGVE